MSDPIKIMDGLESDYIYGGTYEIPVDEWRHLRTAIEADQAKLRAFCEGLEVECLDKLLSKGKAGDFRRLGERMMERIREKNQELAQARAQLAEATERNQTMVCGICGGDRSFIAAVKAEALPVHLDRELAEPLCALEGTCERTGECHGDCDCSSKVQQAWVRLRYLLIEREAKES